MKRILGWTGLTLILAVLSLGKLPGCIPLDGNNPPINGNVLEVDASSLTRTYVTPHLEQPIQAGTSVLWCSTFQLAWNEVIALIGEELHFTEASPMADVLNQMAATSDDIDEASYLAMAGFVGDGIVADIEQAMTDKFPDAVPALIPSDALLRPQDIVAYAYLFKSMMFAEPFERLDDSLVFGSASVAAFGVGPQYDSEQLPMIEQVSILDYVDDDDFIIELETESVNDQVILAKIQPGSTLAATIQAVLARIDGTPPDAMLPGDRLEIPRFNFDISRSYDELEGLQLDVENPDVADDLRILEALQDIRFEFNEQGVVLESEATIVIGCVASVDPTPTHIMIFDEPFLIMLKQVDADQPYFAFWVDNAELMVSAEE